jgi:hypothetical protein
MTDWFMIILIVGAIAGAVAFLLARRRIPFLPRLGKLLVPAGFCLFGFLPAVVLQCTFIERTAPVVLASIIYFILFSVVASVTLNGIAARSDYRANVAASSNGPSARPK